MGTNKEPSVEQSTPEIEEEMDQTPEQNSPVDQESPQSEDGKLLNTYKWHTGAKTETAGQGTLERLEKGASNKWSKMQSWRKALSEDAGEKMSTRGAESPTKPEKPATRKNPFHRALSAPAGSLLSSVLSSSSASGPSNAQASGSSVQDTSQKGKIRKYLQTVSQKFKRPRLQSSSIVEQEKEKAESENVFQEPVRLSWAPQQDVPVWDISSCCLQDGQILIPREEEPLMRVQNHASSCLSSISLQNISESHTGLKQPADDDSVFIFG